MRKILITGILISLNLSLSLNASALTDAQISTKIDNIQANVPTGTPNAPSGMDQKGFVGEMLANLFDGNNKIKGFFIQAFQSIWNTQANTLPRWNGQSFTAGTIQDNGTNIGIGTGILNNRRVNIAGDVNFTGDLYKNGVLFTPTLPTDIVRTFGAQTIGGVKTFTSNMKTENTSPTNYYIDTSHRSAMIHVNDNNFYVLRGSGTGSSTWSAYNGRWPLQINLENNNVLFGGAGNFLGSVITQSGTFIGNGSTLTNLNASNLTSGTINNSRLPNEVVKTYGSQIIGGQKTFTNNPLVENLSPVNYLIDTDHRSAMIHVNNNKFYILRGSNPGSTTWSQYNGYWPLEINLENNDAMFGGNVGIGTLSPTQKLDVNGKIRMRTQTVAGDSADTVATKGYVDTKFTQIPTCTGNNKALGWNGNTWICNDIGSWRPVTLTTSGEPRNLATQDGANFIGGGATAIHGSTRTAQRICELYGESRNTTGRYIEGSMIIGSFSSPSDNWVTYYSNNTWNTIGASTMNSIMHQLGCEIFE